MIAVVPMPEEPPWTSSVSPSARRPRSKTLCQTVKKVSGRAPACDHVEAGRNRQGIRFVRQRVFGIAAARNQGADLVAHLPARDVMAGRRDFARDLQARQVRRALRWRIDAGALQQVRTVDAGGGDANQDLAIGRTGHRPRFGKKHLRAAGLRDRDDGHGFGQGHHRPPTLGCVDAQGSGALALCAGITAGKTGIRRAAFPLRAPRRHG